MLKRTSSRIYPRGFVGPESSTALVIDVAERSMIETQVAPLKQELMYQKPQIIARINEAFGQEVVKEVIIQ